MLSAGSQEDEAAAAVVGMKKQHSTAGEEEDGEPEGTEGPDALEGAVGGCVGPPPEAVGTGPAAAGLGGCGVEPDGLGEAEGEDVVDGALLGGGRLAPGTGETDLGGGRLVAAEGGGALEEEDGGGRRDPAAGGGGLPEEDGLALLLTPFREIPVCAHGPSQRAGMSVEVRGES